MARLDHLQLPARDWRASRDWWHDNLGLEVELEIADRKTVAMKDEAGLSVFLVEGTPLPANPDFSITLQVRDVEATYRALTAKGARFVHPPQKVFWGYGAELLTPTVTGYGYGIQSR